MYRHRAAAYEKNTIRYMWWRTTLSTSVQDTTSLQAVRLRKMAGDAESTANIGDMRGDGVK